ncbi:MAG: SRPBCC family protein [Deltaproteobacteria bacterium]|nr:SRPBCC family protein [Deltaproteobacteria bacterium]
MSTIPLSAALLAIVAGTTSVVIPESLRLPAHVGQLADPRSDRTLSSEGEWPSLERGEVVTDEAADPANRSDARVVRAAVLISRSAEQVWGVLADFERRPEFLAGVDSIHVVRVDGNRVWVDQTVKALFLKLHYQVINTLEPEEGRIRWSLDTTVAHDIADSQGTWRVIPVDKDQRTLLLYQARVESGKPVPAFLETYMVKHSLPGLMEGFRREVERRVRAR